MNKLQQLLKNPRCRFKTTTEMAKDYGQNYMDMIMHMDTLDVLTIMSLYGGKKVYPQLVFIMNGLAKSCFRYGPTACLVHEDMLTTRSYPKFSSRAEILKPGMLVTVKYGVHIGKHIVPNLLRNAPGTTVRILNVHTPLKYFHPKADRVYGDISKYGVVTELLKPVTNQSKGAVEAITQQLFVDHKVVAFEISWHLRKATEVERKFYYSQFHTSEISCSPEMTGRSVPFRGE
jgi:hypothetical protein